MLKCNFMVPDWLQYRVNQYILNNNEDYNSKFIFHTESNTVSIYNKPNKENNAFVRDNPDEELSVFAIDYMNYKGIERLFKTGHIKRLNNESNAVLMQSKH